VAAQLTPAADAARSAAASQVRYHSRHGPQFLVVALAQEQDIPLLSADAEYPIWTPLSAFDAGDTLLQTLETHQGEP